MDMSHALTCLSAQHIQWWGCLSSANSYYLYEVITYTRLFALPQNAHRHEVMYRLCNKTLESDTISGLVELRLQRTTEYTFLRDLGLVDSVPLKAKPV